MYAFRLLLLFGILWCLGCSVTLERPGINVENLHTRSQVQKVFGQPVSKETVDGHLEETYVTRKPIREFVNTWSSSVYYVIPYEAYLRTRRRLLGQELRVRYDNEGYLQDIVVGENGDFLFDGGQLPGTPMKFEGEHPNNASYQ